MDQKEAARIQTLVGERLGRLLFEAAGRRPDNRDGEFSELRIRVARTGTFVGVNEIEAWEVCFEETHRGGR